MLLRTMHLLGATFCIFISTFTICDSTPSPTYNQIDTMMCCQCLEPSTTTKPVKGCIADPQCQTNVCNFDAYCCDQYWDKTCVFYASENCKKTTITTAPFGTTDGESITTTTETPIISSGSIGHSSGWSTVYVGTVEPVVMAGADQCGNCPRDKMGNSYIQIQADNGPGRIDYSKIGHDDTCNICSTTTGPIIYPDSDNKWTYWAHIFYCCATKIPTSTATSTNIPTSTPMYATSTSTSTNIPTSTSIHSTSPRIIYVHR